MVKPPLLPFWQPPFLCVLSQCNKRVINLTKPIHQHIGHAFPVGHANSWPEMGCCWSIAMPITFCLIMRLSRSSALLPWALFTAHDK